jgi:signal peptidase I
MAKEYLKKIWNFLWHDDSPLSFAANIIIAIILIQFVIYPVMGLALGTEYPVVAIVSGSMQHNGIPLDDWWEVKQMEYAPYGILISDFREFRFSGGLNKGDIVFLTRPSNLKVGDVIVFRANQAEPIIHRIIAIDNSGTVPLYTTKGDANPIPMNDHKVSEVNIVPERIIGKASLRIPYVGYVKIGWTCLIDTITGKGCGEANS